MKQTTWYAKDLMWNNRWSYDVLPFNFLRSYLQNWLIVKILQILNFAIQCIYMFQMILTMNTENWISQVGSMLITPFHLLMPSGHATSAKFCHAYETCSSFIWSISTFFQILPVSEPCLHSRYKRILLWRQASSFYDYSQYDLTNNLKIFILTYCIRVPKFNTWLKNKIPICSQYLLSNSLTCLCK